LFEYDLDPKGVFEFMMSNSQNISCYSSLIGFFHQHGIGCEVDEIKASEIYKATVENNQESKSKHDFSSNEETTIHNDDNIKLNEVISQYLYSLFLYKDVILYRKESHKWNIT